MRRKKLAKHISIMLVIAMALQLVSPSLFGGNMEVEAASTDDTFVWEDNFNNYQPDINELFATGLWEVEDDRKHMNAPEIKNNVLKMTTNTGISFLWPQVDGVGEFDSTATYKFEFDATIKEAGGGQGSRVLYFAPGGWLNQVAIEPGSNKVVIGGNGDAGTASSTGYDTYSKEAYSKVHVQMEWTGNEIKSVVTKADGTTVEGCRIKTDYNNNTSRDTDDVVIRCEDGEVEVDNFTFSVNGNVLYEQEFEKLNFLSTEQWDVETTKHPGARPTVSGGVMKMSDRDSVRFNWTTVPGIGEYDSNKTYTFEFDATIRTIGNRVLYAAPGGFYNQIALASSIVIGGGGEEGSFTGSDTYSEDVYLNKTVHLKMEWKGDTITTTLTKPDQTTVTGRRINPSYDSGTTLMSFFVLRCEVGAIDIDNFTFTDGTVTYTEDFNFAGFDIMNGILKQDDDIWDIGDGKADAEAPVYKNNAIRMHGRTSLEFNWTKIPGVGEYDSLAKYTYEFDATVRDLGCGKVWGDNSLHTRALYVANDEYVTQVDLYDGTPVMRVAGKTSIPWTSAHTNARLHIKIEWQGTTVTSTITDASGNVLVTDSRTCEQYMDRMHDLTLRCEEGIVDIDNFKFTKELEYQTAEENISIPAGKQAVYTCDVTYSAGSRAFIEMSGKTADSAEASGELFKINDDGMYIGGYACAGEFGEGTYKVKVCISPEQKATMVEVTLPNGGVVRRGSDKLLFGCTNVEKIVEFWISNVEPTSTVKYEDNGYVKYELDTEPVYEGFEANVYNLVTAFDVDAKTTRTFAWTALADYVVDNAMSVQYRVKGTDTWTTVDAEKEDEETEYELEDYFKADITVLKAGTTYEYRLVTGDKEGKTYTFTTEAENVDNFSFVAIGDSQISNWNGTAGGADTRGAMFAQAALKQAVEETGNPAFIFHTGDVTEHGTNKSHWNYYFKALGDYGKTIPHFAAIGNHDIWADSDNDNTKPGSAENFDLHFNHPNNGGSKAFAEDVVERVDAVGHASSSSLVRNLDETTYSFNYGNVHFVVLNTGAYDTAVPGSADKIIIEAQTEWLRKDLEANKNAEWTILMMHEPLYHRHEVYNRLEGIQEVIEEYGVDLAILGHQHLVTRTYPMKNGQIVSKNVTNEIEAGTGTVYSTIGATAPSRDNWDRFQIDERMHTVVIPEIQTPTYQTVTVNDYEIKVTIKQIDGLVVDEFVIYKEAEVFKGVTAELGGKIGLNFYIPEHHALSEDAYVVFEQNGEEQQTVYLKDLGEEDTTDHGIKFTYLLPAKEMTDMITATLYDGGEVKDVLETSVQDYANRLIEGSETNTEYRDAVELISAMLNYGAYAQEYFDYKTGTLANSNNKVVDNVADVTVDNLEGFKEVKQAIGDLGYLVGTSLVLKGETKLKVFFEFNEDVSVKDLKFYVNGEECECTKSGNYYVIEINNISARQLNERYTVTVTAGDQTFDAYTSAMSYCYSALTNQDDTKLQNVAKALYLYNKAADAYFSN